MWYLSFRSCLNCGSFFVRRGLLCAHCENKITHSDYFGIRQYEENELMIHSLFEWTPGESDIISGLIVALKGDRQQTAWDYWAGILWRERVLNLETDEELCFIPAPSSRPGRDHAAFLAQALAALAGGEILLPLKKLSQTHQRTANKELRSHIQIVSSVNFAELKQQKRYVLVDDVITTGATAKACYEALGKPPYFEVWVLGKRGLSCEVSIDLL